MKISVICVTNRLGAVKFLEEQLNKQTFKDYQVIIADDLATKDIGWHFKPRQKNSGDAWNINKAYNDALNRVKGELIVFLQDFIWIPSNGLERFWELYQLFPRDLVTGVGHKAQSGIKGISEVDARVFSGPGVTEGNESHYELNWASAPSRLEIMFEEDMDSNYGGENQVYAMKAQSKGAKIWIDSENRCIGLSQADCGGRPKDWETLHFNRTNILQTKWTQYNHNQQ